MCGPQHKANSAASLLLLYYTGSGGSRARCVWAKAMEDTSGIWSGCRRTLRRRGSGTYRKVSWELERPSLALIEAEIRNEPIYNRCSREVIGGQEGIGGAIVVMTVGTT